MAKTALMMACKVVLVCLNNQHQKNLLEILVKYVLGDLKAQGGSPGLSKFAHATLEEEIKHVKPKRLSLWETAKKRGSPATEVETPDTKRRAMASQIDEMLNSMVGTPKPKPAAKAKADPKASAEPKQAPKPKVSPKPAPKPAVEDKTESGDASSSATLAGPAENLAKLLNEWA
jgi:hypothetical protein